MSIISRILLLLLLVSAFGVQAQEVQTEENPDEGVLLETATADEDSETLLLDNSRSKIGRDFYDIFFREYASQPKTPIPSLLPLAATSKTDTLARARPGVDGSEITAFVVTIDELPAAGIGTALLSITLNDQLIWQNYVPLRQEIIETYARNAAETLSQYILNYKDVQQQLSSDDQQGTGIY